jgi:hypothetical protein
MSVSKVRHRKGWVLECRRSESCVQGLCITGGHRGKKGVWEATWSHSPPSPAGLPIDWLKPEKTPTHTLPTGQPPGARRGEMSGRMIYKSATEHRKKV